MAAIAKGPRVGRIRGFRCEEAQAQVAQRTAALELLFSRPEEIERALRDARRAARSGARHYDPARHAALVRLMKARTAARAESICCLTASKNAQAL